MLGEELLATLVTLPKACGFFYLLLLESVVHRVVQVEWTRVWDRNVILLKDWIKILCDAKQRKHFQRYFHNKEHLTLTLRELLQNLFF